MKDKKKFVEIMTGLCEIFGKQTSQFIYKAYFNAFQDYTDQEVEQAVYKIIKTHKYKSLPLPSDIIEVITENRKQKVINNQDVKLLEVVEEERLSTEEIRKLMKEYGLI